MKWCIKGIKGAASGHICCNASREYFQLKVTAEVRSRQNCKDYMLLIRDLVQVGVFNR